MWISNENKVEEVIQQGFSHCCQKKALKYSHSKTIKWLSIPSNGRIWCRNDKLEFNEVALIIVGCFAF